MPKTFRNKSSTSSAHTQQEAVKPKVPVIAPSPLPAQSIFGPLLAPNAVPMLQQAVRSGQARLNAELHRFYGTQRQASAAAMGMRGFHFMLQPLLGIADAIGRDAALKGEVKRLGLGGRLSRASVAKVAGVIAENRPQMVSVKALGSIRNYPESMQSSEPLSSEPEIWYQSDYVQNISGHNIIIIQDDWKFDPPQV